MDLVWSPRRLTALVFVCTVALAGLEAGLALPGSSSPVLRSVHALLELAAVAHVLLLQLVSPVARELVGVQDVQHGERSCPVPDGALESNKWEWFISLKNKTASPFIPCSWIYLNLLFFLVPPQLRFATHFNCYIFNCNINNDHFKFYYFYYYYYYY